MEYAYDDLHRQIKVPGYTFGVQNANYSYTGFLQDYKLANGVSQVFTDDGTGGLGRLATAKAKAPSGTDLANRAYSYDALGNITLIDCQVAEELDSTYTYDS